MLCEVISLPWLFQAFPNSFRVFATYLLGPLLFDPLIGFERYCSDGLDWRLLDLISIFLAAEENVSYEGAGSGRTETELPLRELFFLPQQRNIFIIN